jgi:glycosyltransferase involved in cell wall biosynthesis
MTGSDRRPCRRAVLRSRSLRIAFITSRYLPFRGGVETHIEQIATRLASRGHDVEVLAQERDRRLPVREVMDGVVVRRFGTILPPPAYAWSPSLVRYLWRAGERYDLVHAHNYHALSSLAALVVPTRPLVLTPHYHGTGHSARGRLMHVPYRVLGSRLMRAADAIICVSQSEAALVRSHFPDLASRISVIPNAVDTRLLRSVRAFDCAGTTVLTVGRLLAYKNVRTVVESMTYLDDAFALTVIGEGPERAPLQSLVDRSNLTSRVHLLGRVDDERLRRWLRTASVYVSLSTQEAYGLTLLEALAGGARVIASDIPAHREIVSSLPPGSVTLLPPDAEPAYLAKVIRTAASRHTPPLSPDDLPAWDQVVYRTLQVYEHIVW